MGAFDYPQGGDGCLLVLSCVNRRHLPLGSPEGLCPSGGGIGGVPHNLFFPLPGKEGGHRGMVRGSRTGLPEFMITLFLNIHTRLTRLVSQAFEDGGLPSHPKVRR